jgi:hypothetical protein
MLVSEVVGEGRESVLGGGVLIVVMVSRCRWELCVSRTKRHGGACNIV